MSTSASEPDGLRFRPLERDDFTLLSTWLSRPHVEPWWREPFDPASVEERYGPPVDGLEPTEVFVVEQDGAPIGMVQRYRLDDEPEWRRVMEVTGTPAAAAGIDYLIGEPSRRGHGVGSTMIKTFVADIVFGLHPQWTQACAAPQAGNLASWRALEKAGFRFVGTVEERLGPCRLMVADRLPA